MKRFLPYLSPVLLLAILTGMTRFMPGEFEGLRLKVFDVFQRQLPRTYQEAPVRIIDLDDETLEKYGQWPWPRPLMAELVTRLHEAGAKVISFDILFSEPDRTSPRNILPVWSRVGQLDSIADGLNALPDHDEIFTAAIAKAPVVTAFTLYPDSNDTVPLKKFGLSFSGEDPRRYMPDFHGAIKTLDAMEAAASGNGIIFYIPEHDGVVRRIRSVFQLRGEIYPSLVTESLRVYYGASNIIIKTSSGSGEKNFGEETGFVSLKVGKSIIPTDAYGRLWLYDTGPIPERTIPAWQVLDGTLAPGALDNMIVYIGTSAAGLKDLRATPLDPGAPGVVVHAQLTEQIFLGEFLKRPDWAEGAEMTFLVAVSLILIVLMPLIGAAWSALIGLFSMLGIIYFSWNAFSEHRFLIDPLLPCLAVLIIYILSSLIHFLKTDSDKRQIRSAFGRYLAPAIVEKLANSPEQLRLGGEMKNMTLLFADIRGFTAISEQFEPQELTQFINRFLTPMTDIILQQQGTIDKYMGDCIMAFWNAPIDVPEHAALACRAALEMQSYLRKWNAELEQETRSQGRKFIPVRLGAGINTGDCCVGNMGSQQRFDYSVLGDSVNLASRLEGLCRLYGADVIISEDTYTKVEGFTALELDIVRVKGKSTPTKIYALLAEKTEDAAAESLCGLQARFLKSYRAQDWNEAETLLAEMEKVSFEGFLNMETLCGLYRERIRNYRAQAPQAPWDGVWTALSK